MVLVKLGKIINFNKNYNMETEKKSHGALIGSLIIVLILLIGSIYIWQSKVKEVIEEKNKKEEAIDPENLETSLELNIPEEEINNIDTNIGIGIDKVE